MITAITVIHVVACFFLIVVVLLQTGKGAEMGAVFGGGGSSTVFGASGAGNLLTKLTTGTAILFFVTSLTLAWSSLDRSRSSVFDSALPEPPPREALDEPPAAEPAPIVDADSPPVELGETTGEAETTEPVSSADGAADEPEKTSE